MARGGFVSQGNAGNYEGKVTAFVIITRLVAATGGLLFGYDIVISGGVTSMDEFLMKFFPDMYEKEKNFSGRGSNYRKFDSAILTLFIFSLYLAALVASFFASTTTKALGRKVSMTVGSLVFLAGAIVNGAAMNVAMLIIGRLLLGVGVGALDMLTRLFRFTYQKWHLQRSEVHSILVSKWL